MKDDPMSYESRFFHFLDWVISLRPVPVYGVRLPLSPHHLVGSSVGLKNILNIQPGLTFPFSGGFRHANRPRTFPAIAEAGGVPNQRRLTFQDTC